VAAVAWAEACRHMDKKEKTVMKSSAGLVQVAWVGSGSQRTFVQHGVGSSVRLTIRHGLWCDQRSWLERLN